MASLPTDDRGWFELVLANQPPLWRLYVQACGGEIFTDGDIQAAIIAASPNRSFFNSVFYEDSEHLVDALPRLATAYERAGVNAWKPGDEVVGFDESWRQALCAEQVRDESELVLDLGEQRVVCFVQWTRKDVAHFSPLLILAIILSAMGLNVASGRSNVPVSVTIFSVLRLESTSIVQVWQ